MWPTFFIRVRPASRNAKPACMNITSTAAITTQTVLTAIPRSLLDTCLDLLQLQTRPVVDDVCHRRLPDEPVARLVPAPRRVGDRRLHRVRDLVPDEEGQDGLGQEPRLQHPPAGLLRDPALPAVTDRLDDGHADVAGRILDGIDHGLDPLPDHDRLNLYHALLLPFDQQKKRPQEPADFAVLLRPRCLAAHPRRRTNLGARIP